MAEDNASNQPNVFTGISMKSFNLSEHKIAVVVAWHNHLQRDSFLYAWGIQSLLIPDWLILQQDEKKEGCGVTKNKGIQRAVDLGFETVLILDDDCFPIPESGMTLEGMCELHLRNLEPKLVDLFDEVTKPISRGTPFMFNNKLVEMKVAASMGFWKNVGDYSAPSQLVYGAKQPMEFYPKTIHGRYFAMSGMNLAFRPKEFFPWNQFIDVARYDDVWSGFIFQREAYRRGYCFSLHGPAVWHSRQSDVFKNLREEARYMEENETLWQKIATHNGTYDDILDLLPISQRRSRNL
jgi:hypothetical protein